MIKQKMIRRRPFRSLLMILLATLTMLSSSKSATLAQSNTTLSVSPAQTTVPIASQAQIGLFVTNGVNINAFDITIEYDPEYLRLDGWVNGDYLSNLAVVKKVDEPGSFQLVCTQLATQPVSGNGTLITLFFYAKILGTTQIAITDAEFADALGNLSIPAVVGGSVSIEYASTYTPTATGTNTPIYTPSNTFTPTLPRTATSAGTPAGSTTPAATATSLTKTATRFPTEDATATPWPTLTNTPSPTLTPTETPLLPEEITATAIKRLSATPIFVIGIVEGSSPGPVEDIPSTEQDTLGDLWLWVLLGAILVALIVIVVAVLRRRTGIKNLYTD